jgi:hypothetical protein
MLHLTRKDLVRRDLLHGQLVVLARVAGDLMRTTVPSDRSSQKLTVLVFCNLLKSS